MLRNFALMVCSILLLVGCGNQTEEAYNSGFVDGFREAEKVMKEKYENKLSELERSCSKSFGYSSTEVCGGGGVNLNGKHYSGGKTGCVRVFEDGRVQRY